MFYGIGFGDVMEKFRPHKTVDRLKKLFYSVLYLVSVLSALIYMITKTKLGVGNDITFFVISIIIFFVLLELSYAIFLFLPNKWWYINFYKGFPIYEIVGIIYVSMLITFIFLYGSTLKATLIKFLLL